MSRRRMAIIGRLVFLTLAVTAILPPEAGRAAVPVLVVEGAGWGHGVGMAQDGAYWMGRAGADTAAILGHFYPGTSLARAGGVVRVLVASSSSGEVLFSFPAGGQVGDDPAGNHSPGLPVEVAPGGQVLVTFDGSRYSVHSGDTQPGTASLPVAARQVAARPTRPRLAGASASGPAAMSALTSSPDGAPPPPVPTPDAPSPPSAVPGATTSTTRPPSGRADPSPATTTTTTKPAAPPAASEPGATTTTTTGTAPRAPADVEPAPGPPPPAPSPPVPSSSVPPSTLRPVWAVARSGGAVAVPVLGRQYRGAVQAIRAEASSPALRLVNQVDVEEYLRGMGEVLDPSWPPASLRAQAVAARTYALRAMAGAGELCADQRCQVYLGQQVEYPAMDRAVADTAGQVLTFGGRLVSAVYSANGGGTTASREEGFGPNASGWEPGFAYLRVAPYHTRDKFPWSVTIALAAIATRLDYPGVLSSVTVPSVGPSGRALAVSVDGSAGPRVLSGIEFAGDLGLRSTLFRLHLEAADDVPSLSVPSPLQLPPEDSAGLQPTMLPTADDGRSSPGGASGSADGSAGQRSKEIGETPGSHGWGPSPGWFSLLPMRPGAPARQRRSAGRRPAGSSSDLRLLGD